MDGKFIVYKLDPPEDGTDYPWRWVFQNDLAALGECSLLAACTIGFKTPEITELEVTRFWDALGLTGEPSIERRVRPEPGPPVGVRFRAEQKPSMLAAAKKSLATAEECEHLDDLVSMRDELMLGILQSNIAIAEARS